MYKQYVEAQRKIIKIGISWLGALSFQCALIHCYLTFIIHISYRTNICHIELCLQQTSVNLIFDAVINQPRGMNSPIEHINAVIHMMI